MSAESSFFSHLAMKSIECFFNDVLFKITSWRNCGSRDSLSAVPYISRDCYILLWDLCSIHSCWGLPTLSLCYCFDPFVCSWEEWMTKVSIGLSDLSGGTAKTWQKITLPSFFEDEISSSANVCLNIGRKMRSL